MKKSIFHKAVSVIMACAVAVSATITSVFADEPTGSDPKYTITIKGTDNLQFEENADYTFKAYQLLDGTVEKEGGKNYLTSIRWGEGFAKVDGSNEAAVEAFLEELKLENDAFKITVTDNGVTKTVNAFKDVTTAIELAKTLQDQIDDSEFMQEFAKIAAKHLTVSAATAERDGDEYVIELEKGGYYLIKDETVVTDANENPYALSTPILRVLGQEEVVIKSDIPTLDKSIIAVDDSDANVSQGNKSAAAGVGSTVSFRLTGTLPGNYTSYESYYYEFNDVLPEGLTLKEDSIKLNVKIGRNYTPIDVSNSADDNVYYTVVGNTLKVIIKNLKAVQGVTIDKAALLSTGVSIIVDYDTIVNSAAATEGMLENEADLTFSNDPNNSGTGDGGSKDKTDKTPKKKATVVVFEIDMDKNNGDGVKAVNIKGVGFTVTDGNGKTAVFHKDADGTYTFVAWVDLDDYTIEGDEIIFDAQTWADDNAQLLEDIFGEGTDVVDDLDVEVVTGSAGFGDKNLKLKGLAPADYVFTESSPKSGYVAVEDFTVTLVAQVEWTIVYTDSEDETQIATITDSNKDFDVEAYVAELGGTLSEEQPPVFKYTGKLYYKLDKNDNDEDVVVEGGTFVTDAVAAAANGDNVTIMPTTTNKADLNVIDDPKSGLPSTGGAGAWFYYICGGLLVACGIALLVFSKKKSGKKA